MTVGKLKRLIDSDLRFHFARRNLMNHVFEAESQDGQDNEDLDVDDAVNDEPADDSQSDKILSEIGTSLDAQIDRYLIDYEKEGSYAVSEGFDTRSFVRCLLEGDSQTNYSGELDVDSFASSVARLIENFENLIEVRSTIVRRAEAFLRRGHADSIVRRFVETMQGQYDISTDDQDDDEFPAPAAAGAGNGSGGA